MIDIIEFFKNFVFFVAYIYFLINDVRLRKVDMKVFIIYGIIGIVLFIIDLENLDIKEIVNTLYSVCFGLMILLFSFASRETIGIGDSIFFIVNGLYMSLSDNVMLFLTGIIIASVYGFIKYIQYRKNSFSISGLRVPFMPCLLPMIIWRVACLL